MKCWDLDYQEHIKAFIGEWYWTYWKLMCLGLEHATTKLVGWSWCINVILDWNRGSISRIWFDWEARLEVKRINFLTINLWQQAHAISFDSDLVAVLPMQILHICLGYFSMIIKEKHHNLKKKVCPNIINQIESLDYTLFIL